MLSSAEGACRSTQEAYASLDLGGGPAEFPGMLIAWVSPHHLSQTPRA